MRSLRDRFCENRYRAVERGEPWELTFEQWLKIWTVSGHLHERGNKRGNFCLSRISDKGAYAVGNVRIITVVQKTREVHLGKQHRLGHKHSAATREKLRKAHRARKGETG